MKYSDQSNGTTSGRFLWEGCGQLKYFRVKLFRKLMEPFSRYMRKRRMRLFVQRMSPVAGMKVLDLGGQPAIWDDVAPCLNITCLNLPGVADQNYESHHKINYVIGDACNLIEWQFGDFDIVFSNSVLEHVGDVVKQDAFAREVRRLSDNYWIQTPSKFFPIEAHCGMPFWWFYPAWLRTFFLDRWSRKLPAWTEMVSTTTYIPRKRLISLFPDAKIINEWFIFQKSLIAFKATEHVKETLNKSAAL